MLNILENLDFKKDSGTISYDGHLNLAFCGMQRGGAGKLGLLLAVEDRQEQVEYSSSDIPFLRSVAETFGELINTTVW